MGLMSRFSMIFRSKANKMLDKAEDPRETLDYSYEKQLEMLQKVRRGVADVATSKKRIELQATKLEQSVEKLDGQARQALGAGREDLARTALERKKGVQLQLQGLDEQKAQLQAEQEKLQSAEQRLTAKIESFRTRKETIKAQYTAAETQSKIGEALSGVSEDMADVGLAVDRAENKTEQMRARAGAIDELIETGALEDFSGSGDPIDRELREISMTSGVDDELANMKAEIGAGDSGEKAGEIGAGDGSGNDDKKGSS
jgi:phage shock protein A